MSSNQNYHNNQVSSCREEAVQLSMLPALATVREPVIWHTSSNGTPIVPHQPPFLLPAYPPTSSIDGDSTHSCFFNSVPRPAAVS